MSDASALIGMEEALARLQLRPAELYREIKAGNLPATKTLDQVQFALADVEAFEAKRLEEGTALTSEAGEWFARLRPEGGEAPPDVEGKAGPAQCAALAEYALRVGAAAKWQGLHLDPVGDGYRVLSRDDGVLADRGRMSTALADGVRAAIKAKMGAAAGEPGPASALFTLACGETTCQVRATAAPTATGEHLHVAFWDESLPADLAELGYTAEQADALNRALSGRPGLLLVAGPDDAFAVRRRLALAGMLAVGNRLVVSLEHGIRFRSEPLVQLDIQGEGDAVFARVFPVALAMAPDVLFLDDIRNRAEAEAMFEAVAAGVTVVGHVRTSGNAEGVLRLLGMELSRQLLARDLLGVVGAHLFPRLCPDCRSRRPLVPAETEMLGAEAGAEGSVPAGCDRCGDGHLGRVALHDVWPGSAALATLIRGSEGKPEEFRAWTQEGPLSLRAALRDAVLGGEVDVRHALAAFDAPR